MATLKQRIISSGVIRLERLPAVLARTGLSRSALYRKLAEGNFPRPVKLGERSVAWPASAVSHWINARMTRNDVQ